MWPRLTNQRGLCQTWIDGGLAVACTSRAPRDCPLLAVERAADLSPSTAVWAKQAVAHREVLFGAMSLTVALSLVLRSPDGSVSCALTF